MCAFRVIWDCGYMPPHPYSFFQFTVRGFAVEWFGEIVVQYVCSCINACMLYFRCCSPTQSVEPFLQMSWPHLKCSTKNIPYYYSHNSTAKELCCKLIWWHDRIMSNGIQILQRLKLYKFSVSRFTKKVSCNWHNALTRNETVWSLPMTVSCSATQ